MNVVPVLIPANPNTAPSGNTPTGAPSVSSPLYEDVFKPGRSTVERVTTINEAAGGLLVRALGRMACHPLKTAASFVQQMFEPLYDPIGGIKRCWAAYKRDGWLGGAMNMSLYISSAVCTLSFLAMGVGLLLAPFTAGASLAVLPIASSVMLWSGFHDAAMTVALLAKDEYGALHSKDQDELDHKEEELADDFLNTFFAWVTLPMTDAESAVALAPQGLIGAARPAMRRVGKTVAVDAKRAIGRAVDTTVRGGPGLPTVGLRQAPGPGIGQQAGARMTTVATRTQSQKSQGGRN